MATVGASETSSVYQRQRQDSGSLLNRTPPGGIKLAQIQTRHSPDTLPKRASEECTEEFVDHRKRRRNRTTQSCLNCHGSKRMCDRRRPSCGRCVKLGLSGTCVYEVDDISRRDPEHNEIALLKNRIAELEGFIREFKRKPHPRFNAETRRRSALSASSALFSTSEGDCEPRSDSRKAATSESRATLVHIECSSESDDSPLTPSVPDDEPILLASPESPPSGVGSSLSQRVQPKSSIISEKAGTSGSVNIDSIFDFGNNGLPRDDNDTLERVFARILQQEERSASQPAGNCQCMEQSPAYSCILELVPHLSRAVNVLRSAPEHHGQISGFDSPCNYLSQLQSLNDIISSVVASPPRTHPPSSPAHINQAFAVRDNPTLSSIPCAEDSPLQRVIAARRAGLVPLPPPFSDMPTTAARSANIPGTSSAPILTSATPDDDKFMSWESTSRGPWPRTISL